MHERFYMFIYLTHLKQSTRLFQIRGLHLICGEACPSTCRTCRARFCLNGCTVARIDMMSGFCSAPSRGSSSRDERRKVTEDTDPWGAGLPSETPWSWVLTNFACCAGANLHNLEFHKNRNKVGLWVSQQGSVTRELRLVGWTAMPEQPILRIPDLVRPDPALLAICDSTDQVAHDGWFLV